MWWTEPPWNWGYSAEILNRAWLTWKHSMRKQISSSDKSTDNRPCAGLCVEHRGPERRGWNIWLWIKELLICLQLRCNMNIHIRHMCHNCRTQKISTYIIRPSRTAWRNATLASGMKMTNRSPKSLVRCWKRGWVGKQRHSWQTCIDTVED